MPRYGATIHPLVVEVTHRQIRTLRVIYIIMNLLLAVLLGLALWLGGPADFSYFHEFDWIKLFLAVTALVLLGLVVPFSRNRLIKPEKILEVGPQDLKKLGLPENIDERIGRQALFLSRYTAGCVATWGICEAVGLYGLMTGMMGASGWITGLFFAAPAFTMALLPPSSSSVFTALDTFNQVE